MVVLNTSMVFYCSSWYLSKVIAEILLATFHDLKWPWQQGEGSLVAIFLINAKLKVVSLWFCDISKTATRSAAKFEVPAQKKYIMCVIFYFLVPRPKGKVTRSGQSQMCAPGPASNLMIVLLVCSFSPNVFNLCGWNIGVDTYRMYIFHFNDLRAGKFSTQPIISLRGNYSSGHNFWTKGDKRMKGIPMCFSCAPKSFFCSKNWN